MNTTASIIRGCVSADTIAAWSSYLESAAEELAKIDRDSSSMYSQRERELHLEFEQLIESRVSALCTQHGTTLRDFSAALSGDLADDVAAAVQVFTQVLLLGSEFEVFVDVVRSREKREYFVHILRQWQRAWHS